MKGIQSGILALTVVSFAVPAQDNATDDLEPAVSTEVLEQMDSGRRPETEANDPADIDPAVPTAVLAADVRRRTGNSGGVMDELDLGRTEITGNQELPKVLYIVPWQKSDPGDLTGKPVNTLLDEVLAPVDRTEFLRQVEYYDDLYGENE
jgi:hypothetical protein